MVSRRVLFNAGPCSGSLNHVPRVYGLRSGFWARPPRGGLRRTWVTRVTAPIAQHENRQTPAATQTVGWRYKPFFFI